MTAGYPGYHPLCIPMMRDKGPKKDKKDPHSDPVVRWANNPTLKSVNPCRWPAPHHAVPAGFGGSPADGLMTMCMVTIVSALISPMSLR